MSPTSVTTEPRLDAPLANLCFLLGRAFQQPDGFSGDEPRLLREALDASALDLNPQGTDLMREWEAALDADPNTLLRDYARLFLGPFEILAAPYASFYLDPEQRLMGAISQEVARHYAEAGLAPRDDQPCDAPDHIVNECEFLYYVVHQSLSARNSDQAGTWRGHFHRFTSDHFTQWIPRFCQTAQAVEPLHPFYVTLIRFTRRVAEQLATFK